MTENLKRFTSQRVTVDTPVGAFAGILRRAERSAHEGVGNLLLDSGSSWLLVKAWIAIKTSTADADATLSRSLRAVEAPREKFLDRKAVANNMVKQSLGNQGENPLNWNVESLRNMGAMENGEF